MTDFHMHVLPGMDDGSRSVEMSIGMLERSAAYGVDTVCATSHFYADENSLAEFLERRQTAYVHLQEAIADRDDLPRIRLGAEVCYFTGLSAEEDLDALCLEGTNLLLLEMPFTPWTGHMLREVDAIRRRGIQPVAAHIERYMSFQPKATMKAFMEMDVLIQCNASFFLDRKTARKAIKMFRAGQIRFLGSDAHNLSSRAPNLGDAAELLRKKLGREEWERFAEETDLLAGGDVPAA